MDLIYKKHIELMNKIKTLMPEGKRIVQVGSDLAVIMPDKKHIDLNMANYEYNRGCNCLDKYLMEL